MRLDFLGRKLCIQKADMVTTDQFVPNTTEQDLHENGAGITTIMNIGFVPARFLPG